MYTSQADGTESLAGFAEELFGHLNRADQRRWAETYLHGLLTAPGKKSIQELARAVSRSRTASHSLQQFINQSPWDWGPARHALTRWVTARTPVRAWVADLAVIPKRGDHSVGVHRRFVPEHGRTINCQVGVGLFAATAAGAVPVDWRILLSGPWSEDERRRRTRVPPEARCRPSWADVLDLVDELTASGVAVPDVPVLADLRTTGDGGKLVSRLAARGADFLVEVGPTQPVAVAPGDAAARGGAARGPGPWLPARELVREGMTHPYAMSVCEGGRERRLHVVTRLVHLPGPRPAASVHRLFAQWSPADRTPPRFWITGRAERRPSELVALLRLFQGTGTALEELAGTFGLLDFEGRSFPGWHHHMTLVSAAYAISRPGLAGRDAALGPAGEAGGTLLTR
ncbi:IS701 family transposase [Streptomyces sp. NPDC001595]|uniref:IS701 family transposase n=1 Tax=Streptomyces sp. NPDC001532 TaxID=3154520 RepID=UPI00332E4514